MQSGAGGAQRQETHHLLEHKRSVGETTWGSGLNGSREAAPCGDIGTW